MPSYYQRVAEMLKLERPASSAPGPGLLSGRSGTIMRVLRAVVVAVIVAGAITYAGDWAWLRYRIVRGNAYGSVMVQTYYAIHEKSGKTEFQTAEPQPETCANSLFPHGGFSPCWYMSRHGERRIDI
jgi:hypothetical protein